MIINPYRFGASAPPVDIGFQTVWKTDNAGSSASNQINLKPDPGYLGGIYDCDVDWGDGNSDHMTTYSDAAWLHTYASAGTYTVTITGSMTKFAAYVGGDTGKFLKINNFGNLGWNSFNSAFGYCANLDIEPGATGDFTGVLDMSYAFYQSPKISWYPTFTGNKAANWERAFGYNTTFAGVFPLVDLTYCTNLAVTWAGDNKITGFPAIDTSGVTIWNYAFAGMSLLSAVPDLDYSAGVGFYGFAQSSGVTSLPSGFGLQLGNGNEFTSMFAGCTINTTDYSQFLVDLESVNSSSGLSFHGGYSKYNPAGGVARAALVSRGWTIADGGPA